MHDDGKLAGHRDSRAFEPKLLPEFEPPHPQVAPPSGPRQKDCSGLVEEPAHMGVVAPGDMAVLEAEAVRNLEVIWLLRGLRHRWRDGDNDGLLILQIVVVALFGIEQQPLSGKIWMRHRSETLLVDPDEVVKKFDDGTDARQTLLVGVHEQPIAACHLNFGQDTAQPRVLFGGKDM
jgi:hypothetical protein